MKEWIRRVDEANRSWTECPYCHMIFKQMVNSKWCPACDRAVLLTKGFPYSNYIPISPEEHKYLEGRKQFISKVIDEGVDIFEKDSYLI